MLFRASYRCPTAEARPALMPETRAAFMPETRAVLMPGPANRRAVAKLRAPELTCGLDENCGLDTIIT
jgi:hypothetical protein